MPIRVADYIAESLAEHGVRHVFMVTGGAAMHLNDAFGRCKKLSIVCCHHEQACAMAAESYFRVSNRLAAVNVTAGPGGTNTITGVYGAYVDSMAMIVVSGQGKRETLIASTGLPLRQYGDQEVDIVKIVQGVTKYAVTIKIRSPFVTIWSGLCTWALNGRPGPVWLDVPIDVQAAKIIVEDLTGYDPEEDVVKFETTDLDVAICDIVLRLAKAERPVIYAGTGIRLADQYRAFLTLADRLGIPVVTAWNSNDLLPDDHPAYAGRPGSLGNRAGNFTVQNADLLVVLGCR